MNTMSRILVIIVLIVYVALYAVRCPASPPIELKQLSLSAFSFLASLFLYRRIAEDIVENIKVLGFSALLFLYGLILISQAMLFGDSLGRPNWYRSVGWQCFSF